MVTLDFEQKAIIIGENGHQEHTVINCVRISIGKMRHVQYPRSIYRNNEKYILIKYTPSSDLLVYKLFKKDPWHDSESKVYRGGK